MADNLNYNEPGAGPEVATDDVGGIHYQKFKLDGGADGASEPVTGSTIFGLDVRTKGFLSVGNSSTDTLAASAVFVGQGEEVLHYSAITINVFSNVPSVTGSTSGLVLEWSNDNTNWDRQELFYYRIGSMGFSYTTRPKGRYFRLWYRNNLSTAQGSFRLQTIYHATPIRVESSQDNGRVVVDGISYPVKQASVNATAAGDNTVIAAVTNKRLRILLLLHTGSGDLVIEYKSGSNVIINGMSFANRGGLGLNAMPFGYILETNVGEAFVMSLSSARNVRGTVNYIELP